MSCLIRAEGLAGFCVQRQRPLRTNAAGLLLVCQVQFGKESYSDILVQTEKTGGAEKYPLIFASVLQSLNTFQHSHFVSTVSEGDVRKMIAARSREA